MKIGKNTQLQLIHTMKQNHANSVLERAIALTSETLKATNTNFDRDTFKKSFTGYVTAEIEKNAVMKLIGKEKVFTQWNQLRLLESTYKEYNVNLETNPKSLYEYHTTNSNQVKAYEYSIKLCELLNSHPTKGQQRIDIPLLKQGQTYTPDYEAILMLK
jgi:hypothetical protein